MARECKQEKPRTCQKCKKEFVTTADQIKNHAAICEGVENP